MQRIFLSYEYRHDAAWAKAVRAIWVAQGGTATLESAQGNSDIAVRRWIDRQLATAAATIVLLGPHTAASNWVRYKIRRTKVLRKGLLGIASGAQDGRHTGGPRLPMLAGHALYDWIEDDGASNLAAWVAEAVRSAHREVAVTACSL